MNRICFALLAALLLTACASGVGEKIRYDFGIGEKPEGYVSTSEKVMAALPEIGATEMQRLNTAGRQGEIKYEERSEFRGKFYKESKVYERAIPLEAKATPTTSSNRGGRTFVGYIEYVYRIYQGPRRATRAAAQADNAIISTGETGRETYRYRFGPGGGWKGGKGERTKK